jgi:hypothetical protein
MKSRRNRLEDLPLYANDIQIGEAILGPGRGHDWACIATALEGQGLPRVDPLHKGRYVPAVLHYYDLRHGVVGVSMPATDGREHPEIWANSKRRA